MRSYQWLCVLLLALLLATGVPRPSQAQSPIEAVVTPENSWPDGIIFRLEASSSAGDVTEARLSFRFAGGSVGQSAPFDFEPASSVEAEAHIDRTGDNPPAALIEYQVRVRDSAGNEMTTEPEQIAYYPPQYDWQEITSGDATFVWYEGSAEWAEEMAALSAPSVERAEQLFGVDVDAPVRIVAFPDSSALHDAWPDLDAFAGGVTPQGTGMTVQTLYPDLSNASQRDWNEKVIPHEIAHVVWFHATDRMFAPAPEWLVEGLALYVEPGDHPTERGQMEDVVEGGRIRRLSELRSNTTGSHDTAGDAYAQYWSLGTFFVEQCSEAGVAEMVDELNTGKTLDDAMSTACGFDEQTLYSNWYESLTGSPPPDSAAPSEQESEQPTEPETPPEQDEPSQPGEQPQPDDPNPPADAPLQTQTGGLPGWLGPALIIGGLGLFGVGLILLIGITIAMRRS